MASTEIYMTGIFPTTRVKCVYENRCCQV